MEAWGGLLGWWMGMVAVLWGSAEKVERKKQKLVQMHHTYVARRLFLIFFLPPTQSPAHYQQHRKDRTPALHYTIHYTLRCTAEADAEPGPRDTVARRFRSMLARAN